MPKKRLQIALVRSARCALGIGATLALLRGWHEATTAVTTTSFRGVFEPESTRIDAALGASVPLFRTILRYVPNDGVIVVVLPVEETAVMAEVMLSSLLPTRRFIPVIRDAPAGTPRQVARTVRDIAQTLPPDAFILSPPPVGGSTLDLGPTRLVVNGEGFTLWQRQVPQGG